MARPKKGMHKADIKAAIAKRGYTLTGLSASWGYHRSAISTALAKQWPELEARIADVIGVPASEIWPDRYQANGLPKKGYVTYRITQSATASNNQLSQAA